MHRLIVHPDSPSTSVSEVTAQLAIGGPGELWVEFMIAPTQGVLLPEPKVGKRRDNLWQSTCFEVFLKPEDKQEYYEFNLSPSLEWAAYRFDSYRSGMRDLPLRFDPNLELTMDAGRTHYWLATDLALPDVQSSNLRVGLSAIVEERDGLKSYWALAHPPGEPDFHNPACFAYILPPFEPE